MTTKTKFRTTRCLCYKGTKYESIKDCVITENGEKHIIQEMKDGIKYFTINNPYNNSSLRDREFIGRIGDAIQSIRDGYADVLLCGDGLNVFSQYASPIVIIDTELGEEYRQKFIDGFKDTKIGYSIFYGSKNSFGGYYATTEYGDMSLFEKPQVYDTEEEAKTKLDEYVKKASDYAKASIGDNNTFVGMSKEKMPSIVNDIAWDMIEELPNDKVKLRDDLNNLPNIGFDVRQVVKTN